MIFITLICAIKASQIGNIMSYVETENWNLKMYEKEKDKELSKSSLKVIIKVIIIIFQSLLRNYSN